MNKLFTTQDATLPTIRKASRIGDKSRIGRPQADLIALAQATKAVAVKRNNYWYAETITGKVLKSAAERIVITNFIRVWNQ